MEYRSKYTYEQRFGQPLHTWQVIGPIGGLHLHIADCGERHQEKYGGRYSGGIECHWRAPPAHKRDQSPTHDHCWLLQCPCWHDGSSLAAREHWIPLWEESPNDHERMFRLLAAEADRQFATDTDD